MLNGSAYKRWVKKQAARRAKIKALIAEGVLTPSDIARRYGISRERVRQIAKMAS